MLTKTQKTRVIKDIATHDKDTGSPEVQVGLITKRIESLTAHLKKNKKDVHSRRGLLQMVADRQKHLNYLMNNDSKRYNAVTKKLGLKKKTV
jgi:small subunit ribosomal protein S15